MAEPSSFDESDAVLGPGGNPNTGSLSIARRETQNGIPFVVSCWKLTQEELDEVNRTGRIWLSVLGRTMPPVNILGVKPDL